MLQLCAKICKWCAYAYVLFHPAIHIYFAATANGENVDSVMHRAVMSWCHTVVRMPSWHVSLVSADVGVTPLERPNPNYSSCNLLRLRLQNLPEQFAALKVVFDPQTSYYNSSMFCTSLYLLNTHPDMISPCIFSLGVYEFIFQCFIRLISCGGLQWRRTNSS